MASETLSQDTRSILERPFEASQIKTRQGQGGKRLAYVEGHAYIARLNEAFDGAWSFEILSYQVLDGEVLVHGRLTASGLVKEAFGGHKRVGGELGDDLKAASTDALKKAASLLGVGLHLYSSSSTKTAPREELPHAAQRPSSRPVGGQAAPAPSATNGTSRQATTRQLERIRVLARTLRRSDEWLTRKVRQHYGAPGLEALTKTQAVHTIDCLTAALDEQNARVN